MKKRIFAGLVVAALFILAFPLLPSLNTHADAAALALNTDDEVFIELVEGGTYRATLLHNKKTSVITGSCDKPLRLVGATGAQAARCLTIEALSAGSGVLTLRLENVAFFAGVRIGMQSAYATSVALVLAEGTANAATGAPGLAGVAVGERAALTIRGSGYGRGDLVATGAAGGAGIGGDAGMGCGKIVIEGGCITARGADGGAGIGAGRNAAGGAISIAGGTIWAMAEGGASSIGKGFGGPAAPSAYVQITGGSVHADNGVSPIPRTGAGPDKGESVWPVRIAMTALTGAKDGVAIDALKLGSSVDAEGRCAYGTEDLFTSLTGGDALVCAYLPARRCAGFVKAGGDWRQLRITHNKETMSCEMALDEAVSIDAGYDNIYFASDAGGAPCLRYGGREFSLLDPAYGKVTQTPFYENETMHTLSNRRMIVLDGSHVVTVIDAELSDAVSGLNLASTHAGIDVRGGEMDLIVSDTLSLIVRNTAKDASGAHAGIRIAKDATLRLYCAAGWNNGAPEHHHACMGDCASVLATGGAGGAGIGCAEGGHGALEIHGCSVIATGGAGAAGIGGGIGASCGTVRILSGRVVAAGGDKAAGIGAGAGASCGKLELSGGTVVSTQGAGGYAAIGDAAAGASSAPSDERYIRITGGSVQAANGVVSPSPRNAAGTEGVEVFPVTLRFAGVDSVTRVRSLTTDSLTYTYSMQGATTDAKGEATVFLPDHTHILSGRIRPNAKGETEYFPAQNGEIRASNAGAVSGILYPPLAGEAQISGQNFVGGKLTAHTKKLPDDAVLFYAWYRMDGAEATLVQAASANGASYAPTMQDLGYRLTVRVSAENYGRYVESTATQPIFTVPGAPEITKVRISGADSLAIGWNEPVVSGGSPIIAYNVYRGDQLLTTTALASTARSYVDRNCAPGGSYAYSVSAINAAGEGRRSDAMAAEMAHAPSAPRNVAASPGLGNGSVAVTWDASESDGGAAIRGYRVLFRPAGSAGSFTAFELPAIAGQPSYSYVLEPGVLLNGESYSFCVEARNLVGGTLSGTVAAMPYIDPAIALGEDKSICVHYRFADEDTAVCSDTIALTTAVGTIARTFPYGAFRISDNAGLSYSMAGVRVSGITSIHQGEVLLSVEVAKSVAANEGYLWYEYTLASGAIRRMHIGTVYFDKTVREASADNYITDYAFASLGVAGTISGDEIHVVVPVGTDVTNLTPTIECDRHARCRPRTGTAQDYTLPVIHTVTAQDGSERRYTVYVEQEKMSLTAYPEEIDFGSLPLGYAQPAPIIAAVRNTGNLKTSVSLQGASSAYILGTLSADSMEPLGEVRFTVQPAAGLGAGSYEETILINGENGADAHIMLRFTVTETEEAADATPDAPASEADGMNPPQENAPQGGEDAGNVAQESETDVAQTALLIGMGGTVAALVPISALRFDRERRLAALLRHLVRK